MDAPAFVWDPESVVVLRNAMSCLSLTRKSVLPPPGTPHRSVSIRLLETKNHPSTPTHASRKIPCKAISFTVHVQREEEEEEEEEGGDAFVFVDSQRYVCGGGET